MTKLLEKAFKEAAKLSNVEQNALARWLLEELKSDKQWDKQFAESEDVLSKLADKAIRERKAKKTKSLDLEKL